MSTPEKNETVERAERILTALDDAREATEAWRIGEQALRAARDTAIRRAAAAGVPQTTLAEHCRVNRTKTVAPATRATTDALPWVQAQTLIQAVHQWAHTAAGSDQ